MKRILFVLSMMISVAYGQSVGQIRYDTTKFLKVGGYNEVKIQNSTKDSVGGLFTNVGNGWGKWLPPRSSGDTLFIGLDTVLVGSSVTASQGLTKSTNDIQLGSATQNASVFTADRYINTNGRNLWLTSRTTSMQIGVDSSVAGGASFIYLKGPYGGQINFYSDTTARTFNGMAWYKGGTLKGSFGNDVGPSTNHFFFDASDDANGFLSYNWEWGGLSHMVIYRTGMQYFAQRGAKRAHFGAATEPGQTLVVTGSQLVTDTAHFAKKMFITDSTGFDLMLSKRASPYETKMMTIADLATLVGAGGLQDLASVLTQGGISTVNTSMQVTNLTDFQLSATGDAGMTAGASLFVHATNDLNIGTNNTDGTTSHIKLRAADSIVFNQPNGKYYAYAIPHSLVATGKMLVWDSVGRTITARAIPTGSGLTVGTTTITSGTDTRVPFNDAGVYNEDAGIVYDKTTDKLTVGSTIGIEPASGSALLTIKSSAGAFTTTFTYDASRNFISDYRDGNVIRVNGNNIGSWVSTGLSVNGGGGTAADFTVRSAGYNPFLFVDVSANAMGVGRGTPAAYLHLGAGTATAGTAPLMFTSGTNLTTAVAGTMEYNGTNLFFTRTGTTRESVITANAVNSVSPTSPNRTITVVIDGTTYYIHAKTTND